MKLTHKALKAINNPVMIIPCKGVQGSMGKEYSSSTAKEYKGVLEVTAGLAAESLLKSV
jgi:hypothetical protein